MLPRVGVVKRNWAQFLKNGIGVAGLTVTVDYHDEGATWVTGASASAGGRDGWYYYDITPDAEGTWGGSFVTAGDVDQKELGFDFFVAPADATPSGIGTATWATTARTLSSAGVQAIWDALTTALTTVGSIGELIVRKLGYITATSVAVADNTGETKTVYSGADYSNTDSRRIDWDITDGPPTLVGGSVSIVIDEALAPNTDATFACTIVDADTVGLELTAAQSATLVPEGRYNYHLTWTSSSGGGGRILPLAEGVMVVKTLS